MSIKESLRECANADGAKAVFKHIQLSSSILCPSTKLDKTKLENCTATVTRNLELKLFSIRPLRVSASVCTVQNPIACPFSA